MVYNRIWGLFFVDWKLLKYMKRAEKITIACIIRAKEEKAQLLQISNLYICYATPLAWLLAPERLPSRACLVPFLYPTSLCIELATGPKALPRFQPSKGKQFKFSFWIEILLVVCRRRPTPQNASKIRGPISTSHFQSNLFPTRHRNIARKKVATDRRLISPPDATDTMAGLLHSGRSAIRVSNFQYTPISLNWLITKPDFDSQSIPPHTKC